VELGRQPTRQGVGEVLGVLARAIPVGLFDNEPIREYLHEIFSLEGRTDDFRELRHRLTVVATDLEAGGAIRFGTPGWDEVPISRAVQASTAVPGIYPPVLIEGRQCVDGVLLKTVHASVALEQGAKLLFCVNPIVPLDTRAGAREGRVPKDLLVTSGLPAVVSQSFRTVIHSRLRVGFSRYASRFPDADVILLEPGADEYELFFQMAFSFRSRRRVCERGYDATRRDLLARYDVLAPILASHGLTLREDVLADDTRDVWRSAELEAHRPRTHRHARPPTVTASLDAALRKLEHRARVGS